MTEAAVRRADADAALATALVEGRRDAAERAWIVLEPVVARTFRRLFPSLAFCHQDLRQEVFLRLFLRIRELRERRALRRFVIGICMGVAQNEMRRVALRRIEVPYAVDELRALGSFELPMEARAALAELDAVLARSCAQERALFVARHVERWDVPSIAARVGLSIGSTKRRLAKASKRIDRRLRGRPALADYIEWTR